MTIGIAGARGFIGSYLLRQFADQNIGNLVALCRTAHAGDEDLGTAVLYGDLLSPEDCAAFTQDLDVVFYLAHCNSPVNSDLDQPNDVRVNLVPLLTLLESISRAGTKPHLVYFSSGGAVYGRSPDRLPFRESDPCEPVSSYGIQKLAAEHYLRLAAERGQIRCTILRVGNAYGTLLPKSRLQGLIGVAINNVLHGHAVRVFGSLDNVRDYVHLDDVCRMAKLVLNQTESFQVLNVGSGTGYSVSEVLKMIEHTAGLPIKLELGHDAALGQGFPDWVVLDVAKGREELGWVPTVQLADGIRGLAARYTDAAVMSTAAGAAAGR